MAQARHAKRAIPQAAIFSLATILVASIVIGAMVATSTLTLPGARPAIQGSRDVSPALIESGREWERQQQLLSRAFTGRSISGDPFSNEWWNQFTTPYREQYGGTDPFSDEWWNQFTTPYRK